MSTELDACLAEFQAAKARLLQTGSTLSAAQDAAAAHRREARRQARAAARALTPGPRFTNGWSRVERAFLAHEYARIDLEARIKTAALQEAADVAEAELLRLAHKGLGIPEVQQHRAR
jgi:hypothetical protein